MRKFKSVNSSCASDMEVQIIFFLPEDPATSMAVLFDMAIYSQGFKLTEIN